jgi:hypothetical protein
MLKAKQNYKIWMKFHNQNNEIKKRTKFTYKNYLYNKNLILTAVEIIVSYHYYNGKIRLHQIHNSKRLYFAIFSHLNNQNK